MKLISTQPVRNDLKRTAAFILVFLLLALTSFAQYNVTEVITDYAGYWKSSATTINPVKPDNSHNLLAFSFKGKRYSTGANDALLTSKSDTFNAQDFRALPVNSISSVANSNTKIGLGFMYDGVANGPSNPAPANDMSTYLTDGVKGLDLGTCVANLPAGTIMFPVSKVVTQSLNDNIPDILITQIADPSGSLDRYDFTDIFGNTVGNYVDIQLDNIASIGNWTADFYDANKTPMTLSGGYTRTDRPIRLWTADLHSFGIDSNNASRIAYFRIRLSGNSDVAFVAYNNNAINIFNSLLPVTLNSFTGREVNNQNELNWQTGAEINTATFIVERSADGNSFNSIGSINASGSSRTTINYSFTDKQPLSGKNYYRLKMVDKDGYTDYSKVVTINNDGSAVISTVSCYPNPARSVITVKHPYAGSNEQLEVVGISGAKMLQQHIDAGSFQTQVNLNGLTAGTYQLIWTDGKNMTTNKLVVL